MLSVQAVSWALRDELPRTRLTADAARGVSLPIAQLVLLVLAEHAGPDGGGAFPSVPTIAREGRLAERTVHKALRVLEDAGVIERDGTGPRGSTRWRLPLGGAHGAGVHDVQGCTTDTGGVHDVQDTPAPRAPEPSLTVLPTGTTPTTSPAATSDVRTVFEAWQESTGKPRAILDAKRKRVIENALKHFELDDVVDAVNGWKFSAHHRGENDRGTVYNDLRVLIGDAERVEKFRDLTRGSTASHAAGLVIGEDGLAQATPEGIAAYVARRNAVNGTSDVAARMERIADRFAQERDDAARLERIAADFAPRDDREEGATR